MKPVKSVSCVLAAFAAFLFASTSQAAPKDGPGRGAPQIEVIGKAADAVTSLEAAQKESIHKIVEDATAAAQAIRADAKGAGADDKEARQAARTKLNELAAETVKKVSDVMNDDQKAEFRKALAEERAKLREGRGDKKPADGDGKRPKREKK